MSDKILGNTNQKLLFIVSAPAGTGKSTLIDMILNEFPSEIGESCSCTTRPPRPGEISRQHYEFISIDEFEHKIAADEFLEYAKVFGNYYGTPRAEVDRLQKEGKHAVLVIDTQGALKIKETVPGIFIFISPPSLEELGNRLFKRRTENEEKRQERLLLAKQEMAKAHHYDYHIINDDLMVTYQILRSIFIAEEHKQKHKRNLI
jgi:guanylate kinase